MDDLALYSEQTTCVICEGTSRPLYDDLPDLTFDSVYRGSLSACQNTECGAVWANPFPGPLVVMDFYSSYYTHTAPSTGNQAGSVQGQSSGAAPKARVKNALRRAAALITGSKVRFSPDLRYLGDRAPGTLLDVGCGSGDFLREARQTGWTVFGQEFDETAAQTARQVSGAEVRIGDLGDVGFDGASFDAITMSNVLEHLPDPNEAVAECYRLLKPGGVLVSISPNPHSALHQIYGEHWRGLEIPRHLFLLPPRATGLLCTRAGFDKIDVFSTPGAFRFMENASARIRAKDVPNQPTLPRVSRLRLLFIHLACAFGLRDMGEWTVVVAHKT